MPHFKCNYCETYYVYPYYKDKDNLRCGGGCGGKLIIPEKEEIDLYMEEQWKRLKKEKSEVKIRRS